MNTILLKSAMDASLAYTVLPGSCYTVKNNCEICDWAQSHND